MAQSPPVHVPPPAPKATAPAPAGQAQAQPSTQNVKDKVASALQSTQQAVAETAQTAYKKLDEAGVPQKVSEQAAALKQQAQPYLDQGAQYISDAADRVANASPADVNQSSLATVAGGVVLLALTCALVGLPLKLAIAAVALVTIGAYLYQYRAGHPTPHTTGSGYQGSSTTGGRTGAVGGLGGARGVGGAAAPTGAAGIPQGGATGAALGATGVGSGPSDATHRLHDQVASQAATVAAHRDPPPPLHPQGVRKSVDEAHHVVSEQAAQVAQQYLPKPEVKG